MKQNYRLTIAYDGTRYHGWEAKQNTEMTIQGRLEQVLARMTGEAVKLIGAGRTDAGVHAQAMTANVHLEIGPGRELPGAASEQGTDTCPITRPGAVMDSCPNTRPGAVSKQSMNPCPITQPDTRQSPPAAAALTGSEAAIRDYLNRYLPEDICVREVKAVSDRFHSRYNAAGKTYCYTCYDGLSKPVFDRRYVYVLDRSPDLKLMRRAAGYLIGTHDFASFCGNPKMKKSTVRTIESISIERHGEYLKFLYSGDGFLYHMVRILTGTLLEIGFGRRAPESMPDLLAARQRAQAGFLAPAQGLCLMEVRYL